MTIYTRLGDQGETGLFGGDRVSKDSLRVEVYGTVDEASSWLGLAQVWLKTPDSRDILRHVQQKLQLLAAELASSPKGLSRLEQRLTAEDIAELERIIDQVSAQLSPQKDFVLPGGTRGAGYLDVTRTVVRRAERQAVSLAQQEGVRPEIISYLNRLSDLLYVLARREVVAELVQQVTDKVKECLTGSHQLSIPTLNLTMARELTQVAEEKAQELGVPVVTAVVDDGGNLISLVRQDGALLISIDVAVGKAYTANALKTPTHELTEPAKPGGSLYGIEVFNQGRIVVIGGGYPLRCAGRVLGGLGVSGGTVEEDMVIAQAALRFWEERVDLSTNTALSVR